MKLSEAEFKQYYGSKKSPEILFIPRMKFITLQGTGDPNEEAFQKATEALYAISYAIKMSSKKPNPPNGYYPYTVFPLEGVWDLVDKSLASTVKSNYAYTLMIQQPDFVTQDVFDYYRNEVIKKKDNPRIGDVRFEEIEEGLCCQMIHLGSYDQEPESFRQMEAYCLTQNHPRSSKFHHEIYLSDPRRTDPSKLKTLLRFSVKEQ